MISYAQFLINRYGRSVFFLNGDPTLMACQRLPVKTGRGGGLRSPGLQKKHKVGLPQPEYPVKFREMIYQEICF